MTADFDMKDPDLVKKMHLEGRPGQPEEVAKTIGTLPFLSICYPLPLVRKLRTMSRKYLLLDFFIERLVNVWKSADLWLLSLPAE